MAKVPEIDAGSLGGAALQPMSVDARTQTNNASLVKAQKKAVLSGIFDEAADVYGRRYQASIKAEKAMQIANEGAEATRYSMQLKQDAQKIGNEEEAFAYYKTKMQEYSDGVLSKYDDPLIKADLYGDFSRLSISGEHDMFNWGQERRKSRTIGYLENTIKTQSMAAYDAPDTTRAELELSKAQKAVAASVSSGTIPAATGMKLSQQIRADAANTRIDRLLMSGNVEQAKAEKEYWREALTPEGINNADKRIEARQGQLEKEFERQQEVQDFKGELYGGYAAISGEKEKQNVDKVYADDVLSKSYQSLEEMQQEKLSWIQTTNVVPELEQNAFRGIFNRSAYPADGSPSQVSAEQKVAAAKFVDDIRNVSPVAYQRLDDSVTAQSRQIMSYVSQGYEPEQAVRQLEKNAADMAGNKEALDTVRKEDGYDVTLSGFTDVFDEDYRSMAVQGRASSVYQQAYIDNRMIGLDEDDAAEQAGEAVAKRFGVTEVGGNARVDYLPPEMTLAGKFSANPRENSKRIREDFNVFLKANKFDPDKEDYAVITDRTTEYEWQQKLTPSYQIIRLVEEDDGSERIETLNVRWRPLSWSKEQK